jgi:hypothetical protein
MLEAYAADIEDPTKAKVALIEFQELAIHYKGLREMEVPGVSESDWLSSVKELRRFSRAAYQAEHLGPSFIDRLSTFAKHMFGSRSK